jgi:hypothetical protein
VLRHPRPPATPWLAAARAPLGPPPALPADATWPVLATEPLPSARGRRLVRVNAGGRRCRALVASAIRQRACAQAQPRQSHRRWLTTPRYRRCRLRARPPLPLRCCLTVDGGLRRGRHHHHGRLVADHGRRRRAAFLKPPAGAGLLAQCVHACCSVRERGAAGSCPSPPQRACCTCSLPLPLLLVGGRGGSALPLLHSPPPQRPGSALLPRAPSAPSLPALQPRTRQQSSTQPFSDTCSCRWSPMLPQQRPLGHSLMLPQPSTSTDHNRSSAAHWTWPGGRALSAAAPDSCQ